VANSYPKQVQAFHKALQRLGAVREVTTGFKRLADLGPDTYSLPGEFGDTPHALLRRTGGGLEDEFWANTEFELSRDEAGWLTLEFLAWWVRDLSRSGGQVQMRPMALPPKGYEVQLGRTLKFIIDHFAACADGDPAPMLALMQERADWLNQSLDLYAEVLGDLCKRRRGKKR
jgi:hypothetical protein